MPNHQDQNVENAQATQKTILLVEDDAAIAELLVQMITQETTHLVFGVPDGPQALAFVRDIKPHLLILDYRLPTMHGIELYDRLHTTEGFERIPTIMISANVPQNEIKRRQIMFMRKPFDIYALLATIQKVLMRLERVPRAYARLLSLDGFISPLEMAQRPYPPEPGYSCLH